MIRDWEVLPYGREIGVSRALDMLGLIPMMFTDAVQVSVKEQINQNYRHGGGWQPMQGWRFTPETGVLSYTGDPPYRPIAKAQVGEETVYVYQHAWVCIVQKDGTFEVARMD